MRPPITPEWDQAIARRNQSVPAPAPIFIQSMNSQPLRHLTAAAWAVACLLLLSACASTSLENVEVAEGVTKLSFKKVVGIVLARDPEMRHAAEDELRARAKNVIVIPSYTLITSDADLKDLAKVRAAVQASGADGIITLRPTSYHTESETVSVGGTHTATSYASFGSYYGGYYGGGYSLGVSSGDSYGKEYTYKYNDSVKTSQVLLIESKIYEFPSERQVWKATVVSNNPSSPKQVIRDAVEATLAAMVQADLVPDRGSTAK